MPSKNPPLHVILTGGTIDSFYNIILDKIAPKKKSCIPEYVKGLKLYNEVKFTTIFMKDSRELTNSDLQRILRAVQSSKVKRIIITHGTYTMSDTARMLDAQLKSKDKTIILTGSMMPLDGFNFSDAPFNLGFVVAMVQELKPGVYISMNGNIFTPQEVAKTISEGRFSSLFTKQPL
jgi:L-asparaginase